MVRTAARMRFRVAGAATALLLMLTPALSHSTFAQSNSSSSDSDAAAQLLSQAKSAAQDGDAIDTDDAFSVQQSADSVSGTFITDSDTPVSDFYLEYTVTAPADAADTPFDFGTIFRCPASSDNSCDNNTEYRLIFSSDDENGDGPGWEFAKYTDSIDGDALDSDAFPTDDGATYDVAMAVVGDQGAFSINGEAIATIDTSEISDAGDVILGSGFYQVTSEADRNIKYSNINLYGLDDVDVDTGNGGNSGNRGNATATPGSDDNGGGGAIGGRGNGDKTPTATEEATQEATESAGTTFTSPNYPVSLTYGDPWDINDSVSNNPGTGQSLTSDGVPLEDADFISLTDGTSNLTIYAGASTSTPKEVVDGDVSYFKGSDEFQFYSIAQDADGNDLAGTTPDGDGYYTVVWVTDVGTADAPKDPGEDITVYIEARPIADGQILLIEQYADDDDYNAEISARESLLSGLEIGTSNSNGNTSSDENASPTPASGRDNGADETPTKTSSSSSSSDIDVTLDAVGSDGVDGEAVVSASGSTRSTIDVLAPDADEGTLVVVQEGSCDDLSGTDDFDAGTIDANGESSSRILITPDDLDGDYALTLVDADSQDYANPLSCGNIGD